MNEVPSGVGTLPHHRPAADIAARAELGDEALKLLAPRAFAAEFFGLLLKDRHYPDAVKFLSAALTARGAVWWGCQCAWEAAARAPTAAEAAALKAALTWLADPSEENRQAARQAGDAAGAATPAGGVALAAAFSGGSLAPPGVKAVPPPPTLSARTLARAVILAASKGKPAETPYRFRQFLVFGVDVARGKSRWHDRR
jgi:hypothetical protein